MQQEYMPKGGAAELRKTAEGRRYLAKLQKKYEIDILQPSDPRFNRIYGDKLRKIKEANEKRESIAKQEWGGNQEKAGWEKRRKEGRIIV